MSQQIELTVPRAIYVDANALIGAPKTLVTQPIAEVVHIANLLHFKLCVPEVALEEWLSHCCEDAIKSMQRMQGDARRVGEVLGRCPLQCELLEKNKLIELAKESRLHRIEECGFQRIATPQVQLNDLVKLFVDKRPPFNDGDKGFKDAVIIESVFQHACIDNSFEHIIIATSDKAFGHTSISQRFADKGTTIHIVDGPPQDLFKNLVDKINGMMNEAQSTLWKHRHDQATSFAKKHEQKILSFVNKNARIGRSDLLGYRQYLQRGQKRAGEDAKLDYSRIVSVDGFRPLNVVSAFSYDDPDAPLEGRSRFVITVSVEIDLTIASPNMFAETRVHLDEMNSLLSLPLSLERPENEESITVKRNLTVVATIAADGKEEGNFSDLQLESV